MASVITVGLKGVEKLAQTLNSYALTPAKAKSLLNSLGEVVEEQTKERFDTETGPEGDKWRGLTESYANRKNKKSPGGILTYGGILPGSIERQLQGGGAVLVGATAEYADYHQNAKKESRRRKFLGLSADNIDELQDGIETFMGDHTE